MSGQPAARPTLACGLPAGAVHKILNALDGVGNHDGMIFVSTTNFKDQLDDAPIRDGRGDLRVHFDYCKPDQMLGLLDKFYLP